MSSSEETRTQPHRRTTRENMGRRRPSTRPGGRPQGNQPCPHPVSEFRPPGLGDTHPRGPGSAAKAEGQRGEGRDGRPTSHPLAPSPPGGRSRGSCTCSHPGRSLPSSSGNWGTGAREPHPAAGALSAWSRRPHAAPPPPHTAVLEGISGVSVQTSTPTAISPKTCPHRFPSSNTGLTPEIDPPQPCPACPQGGPAPPQPLLPLRTAPTRGLGGPRWGPVPTREPPQGLPVRTAPTTTLLQKSDPATLARDRLQEKAPGRPPPRHRSASHATPTPASLLLSPRPCQTRSPQGCSSSPNGCPRTTFLPHLPQAPASRGASLATPAAPTLPTASLALPSVCTHRPTPPAAPRASQGYRSTAGPWLPNLARDAAGAHWALVERGCVWPRRGNEEEGEKGQKWAAAPKRGDPPSAPSSPRHPGPSVFPPGGRKHVGRINRVCSVLRKNSFLLPGHVSKRETAMNFRATAQHRPAGRGVCPPGFQGATGHGKAWHMRPCPDAATPPRGAHRQGKPRRGQGFSSREEGITVLTTAGRRKGKKRPKEKARQPRTRPWTTGASHGQNTVLFC